MGDIGRTIRKRTLIPENEPGRITEHPPAPVPAPAPAEPVKVPEPVPA